MSMTEYRNSPSTVITNWRGVTAERTSMQSLTLYCMSRCNGCLSVTYAVHLSRALHQTTDIFVRMLTDGNMSV